MNTKVFFQLQIYDLQIMRDLAGSDLIPRAFDENAMMQSPELDFVGDDLLKNFAYGGDEIQQKVHETITEYSQPCSWLQIKVWINVWETVYPLLIVISTFPR